MGVVNLRTVSTSILIEELSNRFEHCAFIGARMDDFENRRIRRAYKGDNYIISGLCHDLMSNCLNNYLKHEEIVDEDR